MPNRYVTREQPDRSWAVVLEETGTTVRLAGVPQTGLELEDAEALVERLSQQAETLLATRH